MGVQTQCSCHVSQKYPGALFSDTSILQKVTSALLHLSCCLWFCLDG